MNRSKFNMEFARKYGILIVLVVMWILLMIVSPTFRTTKNAVNILRQVSVNGIIAIGMTFVIMTGGIDLTVGSLVAAAGVVSGSILVANPSNVLLAVAAGIVVCALFGAMNGFFVAYMEVPPFVATLAGMTIARGFAYVYSDGKPYTLASEGFSLIGKGMAPIAIFVLILIISHLFLSKMKFGRYIYAVGGNVKAAEASGVKVKHILMKVYILSGVLTGIAGIVLASRTNSGQPAVGMGYETDAIAAAVIGGTSMTGGIGTIPGTLVGILIIGTLNNGLNLLDVSSYYQQIIKGLIILGAVCFDIMSKKISK
ncbi:MAG: ABC transporter permease [Lachnospiraceae bacterium]|jgi:ribose/xylose/arabinose/galactoside ABC-type transport system permease subunit|nr:ABC transporter permease [Lachnospiraceae bacterium]